MLTRLGVNAEPLPRGRTAIQHLLSGRPVEIVTYRLSVLRRPFATALFARALSVRGCVIRDIEGTRREIRPPTVVRLAVGLLRDYALSFGLRRRAAKRVRSSGPKRNSIRLDGTKPPAYLRTDLWFGVESGGSVAHTTGVIESLGRLLGQRPTLITTDDLPAVEGSADSTRVDLGTRYWDFPEDLAFVANEQIEAEAARILTRATPAFVYHRYSLSSDVGARLSARLGVPLVLEYNGSEVWIAQNWGKPLRHRTLSKDIELFALRSAAIVVVVSQPMHDELVQRGIDPQKILVNPNGVDPDRYSPSIDGTEVRTREGVDGMVVFGFIGTFGPWHGAEVLARAFVQLLSDAPALKDRVRLLMIGDGPRRAATEAIIREARLSTAVHFTGRTRQEDGPAHLAACDVLLSPHVPNHDGTPFFGSPTKLFEYMAMGKPIIASRLDQIGEVLTDNVTALLVSPGDTDELAAAMRALLDDPQRRARLGAAARREAVANHTWLEHTRRILDRLRSTYA